MALTRGFLNSKAEFERSHLIQGLLIWILTGYISYAFLQIFRETMRLFTAKIGYRSLLILTESENYIYNLFYAAIALSFGYTIALRFLLQISIERQNGRFFSLSRRVQNNEGFFTKFFFYWFGKLGSILGLLYSLFAIQYDIDFIDEYAFMLILLPLVFFYSSWPSFSRLLGNHKKYWFISISAIFFLMSFILATQNFTDYKEINEGLLRHKIEHLYDLHKPRSQSQQTINRMRPVVDVYVVQDTLESEEPVMFFNSVELRVNLQDVLRDVNSVKDELDENERNGLIANLHIDQAIPMNQINAIINELRKAGIGKVQFSTGRKYSRYPADYPVFKYSGIQKNLYPRYNRSFESFLDSAEQIDLTNKALKLHASALYRQASLSQINKMEISVDPMFVRLNGQKISKLELEKSVYAFIKRRSPDYAIIFNSDDNLTYERYIEYLDLLLTQLDRLRSEMSMNQFDQSYNSWYGGPELDSINKQFPRHVIEWSPEEQRLNKLIQRADKRVYLDK